ncbi:glutathione S-transferase family protein [Endozoicomonas sp. SM1973]|uniref:glutathione transferase n=1 Tax=Spartinivicinus marinus TaxID=2994442 RepID=A0A853I8P8_9GAMM|nr:glutathione S-transferase family protein [Spartinivicinus marinus]MCX4027370.1 glutathione S-transferase family protein [Spartinivicinus marinus]NYZ69219.1 glutathione S-transferase family protein [Spartinivicinus marinus]
MSQQVHIYGPNFSSFVRSVRLVCEEKNISYTTGFSVNGEEIPFKSDKHYKLHPFGKLPVLIHADASICETVAICRYLDQEFPGPELQPSDPVARAKHDQWCSLIAGDIDQAIVRKYLLEFAFPKGENGTIRVDKVKAAEPGVEKALIVLSHQLADQLYIVGDSFTIADALLVPILDYLFSHSEIKYMIEKHSKLQDYLNRVSERKSFQKGVAAAA